MNGENITVNGEPLHNYLDQQEGKEIEEVRKESIGEIKRTLDSGVHTKVKVNGSNYLHGPVTRLNQKGIERCFMQNGEMSILQKVLQKLAACPNYVSVDYLADAIKANRSSVQADLIRCHKIIPDLLTKKSNVVNKHNTTVYSLTKEGFSLGPIGTFQEYQNLTREMKGGHPVKREVQPIIDVTSLDSTGVQPTQLEIAVQELLEYFDQNKVELIPWSLLTQLKKLSSL